jgi:Winged helix DNA-binding domain
LDQLSLSSGTISVRIDQLNRRGLVRRDPDPDDGRSVQVTLTDNGERLFNAVAPEHLANEARLVAALGPEGQAHLAQLLPRRGHPGQYRQRHAAGQARRPDYRSHDPGWFLAARPGQETPARSHRIASSARIRV